MPPFGHAWTQGETLRRPRDGPVAAPPQLGTGRSVATAPSTGHEVAKGNLYRPWTVTGPRGQGGMQEATAEVEAVACSQAGRGVGRRGWRRSQQGKWSDTIPKEYILGRSWVPFDDLTIVGIVTIRRT